MSDIQLTPSELLVMLATVQNADRPGQAEREADFDGEITYEELFGADLSESTLKENTQPGETEKKTSDPMDNAEYRILVYQLITHKGLKAYKLSAEDIRMISTIWQVYQEGRTSYWNSSDLLKPLNNCNLDAMSGIRLLTSLLDRKILHLDNRVDGDYHLNIRNVMEGSFELDTMFINALLDNPVLENCCQKYRLDSGENGRYIKAMLDLLSDIFKSYPELTSSTIEQSGNWYGGILHGVYDTMLSDIRNLPENSASGAVKAKYELSENEFLALLLILFQTEVLRDDIGWVKLVNLLASDALDTKRWEQLFNPRSSLINKGIIDKSQHIRPWQRELNLNREIIQNLMSDESNSESSKMDWQEFLEGDDRFSVIKTRQTIEQLILPEDTKDIISCVVEKLRYPEKYDLSQWGMLAESLSETANNGVLLLLHGNPGTGKTFAAGAIANSLGRQLVSINAPMLKSHYYGDSQQIVKSCFQTMRKVAAETLDPPVFLLNEADQLIHTRLDLSQSCASTENAIQNIILEELETFPGIFIATTNLMENIDPAFFRRFNYKMELPLPDEDCRRQLWKLHLPDTIPGARYIDINLLAEKFILTGGQIKIIVANACSQAIMRQIQNKHITQIDIVRFAELEGIYNREQEHKKIGFLP